MESSKKKLFAVPEFQAEDVYLCLMRILLNLAHTSINIHYLKLSASITFAQSKSTKKYMKTYVVIEKIFQRLMREKKFGIVKKCAVREYPKSWIGRSQAA